MVVAAVVACLTFAIVDALCVYLFFWNKYVETLGRERLRERPLLLPAALFYVVQSVALVTLVVSPAEGDVAKAGGMGAVLGAATYGAYAWTNYSVLRDWPLSLALVDFGYGVLLNATVSALGAWSRHW